MVVGRGSTDQPTVLGIAIAALDLAITTADGGIHVHGGRSDRRGVPFGAGDQASICASVARFSQQLPVSLERPWIWKTPLCLSRAWRIHDQVCFTAKRVRRDGQARRIGR